MSTLGIGMYALGMAGMIAGIYLSLPPAELQDGLQQLQEAYCAHSSPGKLSDAHSTAVIHLMHVRLAEPCSCL